MSLNLPNEFFLHFFRIKTMNISKFLTQATCLGHLIVSDLFDLLSICEPNKYLILNFVLSFPPMVCVIMMQCIVCCKYGISWGKRWDIFPNCLGCDINIGNFTGFLYIQFYKGLCQLSKQFILHGKFRVFFLKPKIFSIKFLSKHIEILIFSYSESCILYIWSKQLTLHEH